MSVERQRSRVTAALLAASLAQDTCLLVANLSSGVGGVFQSVATSFTNYAQTFAWVFNDQQQKYVAITGRSFATAAPAREEEGVEADDED